MVRYIAHLNGGLDSAGVRTQQRFLMQSNGGVMPFSAAIAGGRTVHTLFSGPAAGAQASAYLAREDARARPRHSRHGRHQRRHRLHRRRRAARSDRGGDRAPPDRRACARHDDDLRRRRLDRLDRRRRLSQCRSAERRRRSRPGVLRTRRRAADGHRCRPRVRLSQSRLFPRRHAEAGCRGIARSARGACRRRRCGWTCWRRPPASSASSTCAWPTRCACLRPSAASICPPSRCCRSAAPARYTPPRSPRSSACAAFWCRRVPARSPRSACSAPTWCTTTSARSCGRSRRSPPIMPRTSSGNWSARRGDELAAEGMSAADARFARELDLRYTGQGYELRTPLEGLFADRLTAAALAAARGQVRRAPRPQITATPPRSGRWKW